MTANAGFDIAKEFHWLAVTDDRGRPLLGHRVDNTPDAITDAVSELLAVQEEHGQVTVGLDIIGGIAGLLTAMLLASGLRCVHVPGLAVNRAQRATRGGENKSDPRDARIIAEQVMLREDLRVVDLPDEQAVELRLLVSHRTTLVQEATARIARQARWLGRPAVARWAGATGGWPGWTRSCPSGASRRCCSSGWSRCSRSHWSTTRPGSPESGWCHTSRRPPSGSSPPPSPTSLWAKPLHDPSSPGFWAALGTLALLAVGGSWAAWRFRSREPREEEASAGTTREC